MVSLDHVRKYDQNFQYVHPGPVGPVGDVLIQSRMPTSLPDMKPKFQPLLYDIPRYGSNVQDGSVKSFDTGFANGSVIDSKWGGRRDTKTAYGWKHEDIRKPDRSVTEYLAPTAQYSWLNRVAKVYKARRTGDKFLPLPNGFTKPPEQVARGGAFPQITDIVGPAPAVPQTVARGMFPTDAPEIKPPALGNNKGQGEYMDIGGW